MACSAAIEIDNPSVRKKWRKTEPTKTISN